MTLPRFKLNLRSMIGMHQGRERLDVLLTVVLPLFLMLVSSYTNAWAFTGGNLSLSGPGAVNTLVAIFKGLFVEALVFCFFKLVKILCTLGGWNYLAAVVPFAVGLFGVIVSSGCGVAWAAKSGEMNFLISSVSAYIAPSVSTVFRTGVGMLFPVALAVLAVYDPKHMIQEHIESGADLGKLALLVENAEHHQGMLRAAQADANNDPKIMESYKQMARLNAQQAVEAASAGDYSFGLGKVTEQLVSPASSTPSSVNRINPPVAYPALSAPTMPSLSMPPLSPQQSFIAGQVTTNVPPTGTTQPINIPPLPMPAPAPVQKKGVLNWLAGNVAGN